jgi:two-component system nitrogen regulation response regulator NtrX
MATILVVDDEKSIRSTLKEILEYEGYTIEEAVDGAEALKLLQEKHFDLAICDIKMPKVDGLECLEKSKSAGVGTPFIMLTAHGSIDTALEATKKGAFDFITKPPDLNRLMISVRNGLQQNQLQVQNQELQKKVLKVTSIVGESEPIRKVKEMIERVAPTEARVLVLGPNGSGKELVARSIHQLSERKNKPLVDVNCAAIPSELIESELFGHEKGAFTSAIKQRIGKFEQADGGTLFLDEIGDMSLSAQAKVLRALQEGKITRVGGDKDISVNVRVIAATNKDLKKEIEHGNFREDLYHRLSVIVIQVPSLNQRKDDVPLLVNTFLEKLSSEYGYKKKTLEPAALKKLTQLDFSGNVRQLHNIVERLVIMCGEEITSEDVELHAS